MDELYMISEKTKKHRLVVGGALLLVLVLYLLSQANLSLDPGSLLGGRGFVLTPSFSVSPVSAGNTTVLTVEIKNQLGKDLSNVKIVAIPIDVGISVSPQEFPLESLGDGAYRKVNFNVSVEDTAYAGSYVLEIRAQVNGDVFPQRVRLDVVD